MAAAKMKRGLGKGMSALFGNIDDNTPVSIDHAPAAVKTAEKAAEKTQEKKAQPVKQEIKEEEKKTGEIRVKISEIEANAAQPRKIFDDEQLKELTESVRQYGVLQPLLVQKQAGGKYKIIAGERRYRAAKEAGLKEIPVIIREYSQRQATEISIIENVQRADLNPLEEAEAYQMLISDYALTQEEVAEKVSKNRTTITNALRLLKLNEDVRKFVIDGRLSAGHARTLINLEDAVQTTLAKEIIERGLSVREAEKLVKNSVRKPVSRKKEDLSRYELFFSEYEEKMRSILGTKVHISKRDKNKGRIEIDYYSQAELERIMDMLESLRRG